MKSLIVFVLTIWIGLLVGQQSIQDQQKAAKLEKRSSRYAGLSNDQPKLTDNKGHVKRMTFLHEPVSSGKTTGEMKAKESAGRSQLSCGADLIVIGNIVGKQAYFNKDETYIYTEYKLQIEDTWKANGSKTLNASDQIEFTAPGGVVGINGSVYEVQHPLINQFTLSNKYIVFLKYDKDSDDYYLFDGKGAYAVYDTSVLRLDLTNKSGDVIVGYKNGGEPFRLEVVFQN
jgi:hypothetical protein